MRVHYKRTAYAAFVIIFILTAAGCGKVDTPNPQGGVAATLNPNPYSSFRDIPGVTAEEIAAVQTLRDRYGHFIYGVNHTTEAFPLYSGGKLAVGGYAALLCEWLTVLFGIPFQPVIYEWNDLLSGHENGEIHFSGDLTATDERSGTHFMTSTIAERSLKSFQIAGSTPLAEIIRSRPLRLAVPYGFAPFNYVRETAEYEFETVFIADYADAYRALKSGEADVFLTMDIAETALEPYGDVVSETFYPLVFASASLSTCTRDLEPVISVVQKALDNGGTQYLAGLYSRGRRDYIKNKFLERLTPGELEYLQRYAVVKIATETDSYPLSFYNYNDNEYQGIAFDAIKEIELITGLSFEVANALDAGFRDLTDMVERADASMITAMMRSRERESQFRLPHTPLMSEHPVLISKSEFPHMQFNELSNVTVGIVRGTIHAELFKRWFPNNRSFREYGNLDGVFHALERGEVDMFMAMSNYLLSIENYKEFAGFKTNIEFDNDFNISFGFNKDEAVLCSVVDKALALIDLEAISGYWRHKRYDYRVKVAEAQRPWLIGATALSVAVLCLMILLFRRQRHEGKVLEGLVAKRTEELKDAVGETKKAYAEAMKAYSEAEAASEAKSRFIANMSHEMRTPMNVIVGLTDLMLEEDDMCGEIKESLEKISTAGNTLTGLINDVLDISKVEAGKMNLTPVKYDTASLLNDVITLNIIRAADKPITFKLDINEELPCFLFGDDMRIKQILNNLLSNAFKYTKEGSVTLGVTCEKVSETAPSSPNPYSLTPNPYITFSISDTGIGIRQEDMAKLFTDYNQVDTRANREIEGTGLGLSITKKFVDLMNGEISVESEYGKGTTFRVRIRQGFVTDNPIGKETVKNLRGFRYHDSRKQAQKKLVRSDLSYAKVLVVDDFPTNLDVAAGMLCKYKMQVDCVMSGQESIDRIAAGEPVYNAVFMDHMMPGMDGMEAAKAIRALGTKYAEDIPIIALTANAVAGTEQMFLENGFNAFLPKPFNALLLDSVIKKQIIGNS